MVFHRILNDSKFPLVSRTLLSILTDFNNAGLWMVSTCPPTLQAPFQAPGDSSKHANYNWQHHYSHVLQLFQFSSKV